MPDGSVSQETQDLLNKINSLNEELIKRNRKLVSLNTELQTFTNIAANDYKETLKKLYTGMEHLISNDAKFLSNEGKANVRRAQSAIQKLKLLTEDIISYSTIQTLEPQSQEHVDLNEILLNVQKDLHQHILEGNITLDCGKLATITGYPFLISLLFNHLVDNAIKFRKDDESGRIEISCDEKMGREIDHPLASPNVKYCIITFSDNGIGFGKDNTEHLFIIFSRLHEKGKYKGSGIGLAIAKKIMEMHEGFITGEGIPGEGAVFRCYFPAN
jgi:light-regulated signal transduction histidine kinase (bacteriophytochrome)